MENSIHIQYYQSPCGELILGSYQERLCLCDWVNSTHRNSIDKRINNALKSHYSKTESSTTAKAAEELDEYFRLKRVRFDIPLLLIGTDFQKNVWLELQNIPYGNAISYLEISKRIGNPKAVRAAASAIGANALSIFIPCHRVIGCNRDLTGYAGGVPAKQFLLKLELAI